MRRSHWLLALALVAVLAVPAQAIVIGGYTFDSNAGADQVVGSVGTFANNYQGILTPAQLATALTDGDAGTYAYAYSTPASVDLGFVDNFIVNGAGADLALFDLGVDAEFGVTINGITRLYTTSFTGSSVVSPDSTWMLNVALVDLADFGVGSANAIHINMGLTSAALPLPSLSFAGALNSSSSVPEPGTMLLLGSGMVGLWFGARKRVK